MEPSHILVLFLFGWLAVPKVEGIFTFQCSVTDLSWEKAQDFCKSNHGQLISLVDEDSKAAAEKCRNMWPDRLFFLGLGFIPGSGWRWFRDNSSVTDSRVPWDCETCHRCVVATGASSWHRHNCSSEEKMKFICEYRQNNSDSGKESQNLAHETKPSHPINSTVSKQNSESVCQDRECKNGADCIIKAGLAFCACAEMFTGEKCEVSICNKECQHQGQCDVTAGGAMTCSCLPDYAGEFCEIPVVLTKRHTYNLSVLKTVFIILTVSGLVLAVGHCLLFSKRIPSRKSDNGRNDSTNPVGRGATRDPVEHHDGSIEDEEEQLLPIGDARRPTDLTYNDNSPDLQYPSCTSSHNYEQLCDGNGGRHSELDMHDTELKEGAPCTLQDISETIVKEVG